jgi:hypothetical protein
MLLQKVITTLSETPCMNGTWTDSNRMRYRGVFLGVGGGREDRLTADHSGRAV